MGKANKVINLLVIQEIKNAKQDAIKNGNTGEFIQYRVPARVRGNRHPQGLLMSFRRGPASLQGLPPKDVHQGTLRRLSQLSLRDEKENVVGPAVGPNMQSDSTS